jgi:hypothetical protein
LIISQSKREISSFFLFLEKVERRKRREKARAREKGKRFQEKD